MCMRTSDQTSLSESAGEGHIYQAGRQPEWYETRHSVCMHVSESLTNKLSRDITLWATFCGVAEAMVESINSADLTCRKAESSWAELSFISIVVSITTPKEILVDTFMTDAISRSRHMYFMWLFVAIKVQGRYGTSGDFEQWTNSWVHRWSLSFWSWTVLVVDGTDNLHVLVSLFNKPDPVLDQIDLHKVRSRSRSE